MRLPPLSVLRGAIPALFAVSLGLGDARGDAIQYTVSYIGNLPGLDHTIPYGLNNLGQVVGIAYGINPRDSSSIQASFLYSNGQTTQINVVDAQAINDKGQAVGFIGQYPAEGINNSGQAVGGGGFISSAGTLTPVGSLGTNSYTSAYAINSSGQVVGSSYTAAGDEHPFLYSAGKMADILPTATGLWEARAINDSGVVVGGPINQLGQTFIYGSKSGKTSFIGTLGSFGSEAFGINSQGQVVGSLAPTIDALSLDSTSLQAFIYKDGRMLDLNKLIASVDGLFLSRAVAINDRGQIAVFASLNGLPQAVLLTPVATPEPAMLSVYGIAFSSLLVRRSTRRHP
jgi:probable HAF family extracellular repeat protein